MTKNENCPRKNTDCENHGWCDKCKERHHSAGSLTACERLEQESGK